MAVLSALSSHVRAMRQSRATVWGYVEDVGGLFHGQSDKELELDHLHFACIQRGQAVQRPVERDEVQLRGSSRRHFRNRVSPGWLAPRFAVSCSAREVDENASHRSRGHCQEVLPVLQVNLMCARQTNERLVYQPVVWRLSPGRAPRIQCAA